MTMYINIILEPLPIFFFGGGGAKLGQNPYFKSAFYGFSNINTIILEQPSWDIFRLKVISGHFQPMTDFWAGQKVGRAGQQRWPEVEKNMTVLKTLTPYSSMMLNKVFHIIFRFG